jgi:hypothetical protein
MQWKTRNDFPGVAEEQKKFHLDVAPIALTLLRGRWEVSKYAAFAPISGKDLEDAAQALFDEASSWLPSLGGNVEAFREKQLTFNTSARKVHAELLGLRDSK